MGIDVFILYLYVYEPQQEYNTTFCTRCLLNYLTYKKQIKCVIFVMPSHSPKWKQLHSKQIFIAPTRKLCNHWFVCLFSVLRLMYFQNLV